MADFSISQQTMLPQQAQYKMMYTDACRNVCAFDLVYLAQGFTPAQVAAFKALSPATQAADVMTHLMGYDSLQRPDRGTLIETLLAQFAFVHFKGGSVVQTRPVYLFDFTWTGPPAPVAGIHGLPPLPVPSQKIECKSASMYYKYVDPGKAVRATRANPGFYLYVRAKFFFEDSQVKACLTPGGGIDKVTLAFIQRHGDSKSITCVCVDAKRLRINTTTRGHTPRCGKNNILQIVESQLPHQDPTRKLPDGTLVPSFWPDGNMDPPDVSVIPVTPTDTARLVARICDANSPGGYHGPFSELLGRITG